MSVTHPTASILTGTGTADVDATNAARRARYRALNPLATLNCKECGKEFQQKRPWQIFCQARCSQKNRTADGRSAAAQRRNREKNPERTRKLNRESMRRRNATPEGKRYKKQWSLKQYGITLEIFETIAEQQQGLCAACLCTLDMGFNTHVDHDHKSRVVRGLLCSPCNRGIGGFRDNPSALRRAADYLERNATP